MPVPAAVRLGTGRVPIDVRTTIALTGFVDDRLRAGVTRALVRLQGRTGFVLSREFSANTDSCHTRRHEQGGRATRRRRSAKTSRTRSTRAAQVVLRAPTPWSARCAGSRRCCSSSPATATGFFIPARQDPGSAAVPVARPAHRRRPPLRAGRGHQARARRDGRREAQRAALAPQRGPGLPRREPQVPEAARAGIRRRLLHAGSAARHRRVRAACAASASCPSSTCPAT